MFFLIGAGLVILGLSLIANAAELGVWAVFVGLISIGIGSGLLTSFAA